jgi:ubiquinone biosynthesis protein Coq4
MAVRFRQAAVAVAELLKNPFASSPSVRLVDAMALSWLLDRLHERMVEGLSEQARERLRALTRDPIDVDALLRLPPNTFGHQYAAFLRRHGLSASAVVDVYPPIAETFERRWIPWRSAKLHDMHHFLLDFPLSPRGETALQLFNLLNFREPWGALAMASLPLVIFKFGEPLLLLREMARAWSLSSRAENLWTTPFEELFAMDLSELRAQLRIAA